jgi:hypothetical protein
LSADFIYIETLNLNGGNMETKLKIEHGLFERLSTNPPSWWKNLLADQELYFDIRKDNYINVYYNGGSIMRLEGEDDYKAQIHFEYIPLQQEKNYVSYNINDKEIEFENLKILSLNNFNEDVLTKIKKRIRQFYPNNSEKGIQGRIVTTHNNFEIADGFFLDTEFQYEKSRIDLIWVNIRTKQIYFIELKTINDGRLYIDRYKDNGKIETIDAQLNKYYEFAKENSLKLVDYYDNVFKIKKNLNILPEFVKEKTLKDYSIVPKPILLVGDCSNEWIEQNARKLDEELKDIAFGCFYHGSDAKFYIPSKTTGNKHIFS